MMSSTSADWVKPWWRMHLSMILPSCFLPQTKLISRLEALLRVFPVDEAQVLGDALVEDQAAHGGAPAYGAPPPFTVALIRTRMGTWSSSSPSS